MHGFFLEEKPKQRKIKLDLRQTVLIEDDSGKVLKYRLDTPSGKKKDLKRLAKPKSKPKPKAMPKRGPTLDELAAQLPKCTVNVQLLSKSKVDEIIRKGERDYMIRMIQQKIKCLPCKYKIDWK